MPYDLIKAAARARAARSEKFSRPEFISNRFWSKVHKKSKTECWPWLAGKSHYGYGLFRLRQRGINAHRFAYILAHGEIPRGLIVCHHCDNPPCCNPSHLFVGTNKDNAQDCIAKGRKHSTAGELHGLHKLTDSEVKQMREEYKSGVNCTKLAKKYAVGRVAAAYAVFGRTWKHLDGEAKARPPAGESHGCAKLTEDSVRAIRAAHANRVATMRSLANQFGVTVSNICAVIHRKSWKDI